MATQAAAPAPVRIPLSEPGTLQARLEAIKTKKGAPPLVRGARPDRRHPGVPDLPPARAAERHPLPPPRWVVLQGEIDWYIEGEPGPIHARAGDFVFGPKNRWHHYQLRCQHGSETAESLVGLRRDRDGVWRFATF